jgi:hypothetical protein
MTLSDDLAYFNCLGRLKLIGMLLCSFVWIFSLLALGCRLIVDDDILGDNKPLIFSFLDLCLQEIIYAQQSSLIQNYGLTGVKTAPMYGRRKGT